MNKNTYSCQAKGYRGLLHEEQDLCVRQRHNSGVRDQLLSLGHGLLQGCPPPLAHLPWFFALFDLKVW